MGKTAKPLSILVMDSTLHASPEVQALQAQGHVVHPVAEGAMYYDLIIGPQCWRVEPGLGDLEAILAMVLKGARKEKYGRVSKKSG